MKNAPSATEVRHSVEVEVGTTAGLGGGIALTDGMIHQQDVRRPLGLSREIPAERLRPALDIATTAPTLPARRNVRGLRLVAADLAGRTAPEPK